MHPEVAQLCEKCVGGVRSIAISVSVYMSVCPLAYLQFCVVWTWCPNYSKFSVPVIYCGGSVLLWRQYNTLCTSGFADGVMFSHNGPNTDTGLESAT